MTRRREFSTRTKLQAWDRAGGRCEACGVKIRPGIGPEYDHEIACELGGDNSAGNCRVLCTPCHKPKTASDMKAVVKGRRARAHYAKAKTARNKLPGSKGSGWKAKIGGGWERRDGN